MTFDKVSEGLDWNEDLGKFYGRRLPPIAYVSKVAFVFYFVNCVIISCELYYDNSFGCMLTNYKIFKNIYVS